MIRLWAIAGSAGRGLRRCQQRERARFERAAGAASSMLPRRFDRRPRRRRAARRTARRSTSATVANGFGICVRSQLLQRPVAAGLEVKRQHRIAGRLRQPDGAGLRDARRAARAVDGEAGRLAGRHVARQLQQRLAPAARRRAARGAVAESLDDAGNPLAVEILARDDDDAAAAEVVGGGQNAAVPERHDRLAAAARDRVEVLEAFGAPAKRRRRARR